MALATDDFSAGELEGNMWNVEKKCLPLSIIIIRYKTVTDCEKGKTCVSASKKGRQNKLFSQLCLLFQKKSSSLQMTITTLKSKQLRVYVCFCARKSPGGRLLEKPPVLHGK